MAGIKNLRKIQIAEETTKGTQKAATTIWRGTGVLDDQREVVMVDEDVGFISGTTRSYTSYHQAAITFDETPATFEQLPYILDCGIKSVSGVQDGSGSDYIYTYALPTTSANTIKSLSIEGGDNQQEEEGAYFFVESFNLSGSSREAVMMSADWLGRTVAPDSFTGGLSLPSVEEILFGKGKIYIDTIGGTFGGTQKTSTLLQFNLDVTTGFVPKFTADGELYFTFEACAEDLVFELDVTLEHDANAVTMVSDWKAETAKLIRLEFEGSAVETAGTTYSNKTLIIDLAGKWEYVEPLGEIDGNDVRVGRFISRYDETATDWGKFIVVNELSALP